MQIFGGILKSFLFWYRIVGAFLSAIGILAVALRRGEVSLPDLTVQLVETYSQIREVIFEFVAALFLWNVSPDWQDASFVICVFSSLCLASIIKSVREGYGASVLGGMVIVVLGSILFTMHGVTEIPIVANFFQHLVDVASILGGGSEVLTKTYTYLLLLSVILFFYPIATLIGMLGMIVTLPDMTKDLWASYKGNKYEADSSVEIKWSHLLRFSISLWLNTLALAVAIATLLLLPL